MTENVVLETPTITVVVDDERIARLVMDDPTQPTNTMNDAFGRSFADTVAWLERHRDDYVGVVMTSGKDSFFAGGDLELLRDAGPDDEGRIAAALDFTKNNLRRLETLGRPVVAALTGTALGGGFEVALACHRRIALDRPSSRFGTPEVTLGLLPGAGGVTRVTRMLGVTTALTSVVGRGQRYRPAAALKVGLVDEIADSPDALLRSAHHWIRANPGARQPWDHEGFSVPGGTPTRAEASTAFTPIPITDRERLRGAQRSASEAVFLTAVDGAALDADAAFALETRYCTELVCGATSGNLIQSLFFDMGAVTKGASRPSGEPRREPTRVLVVGAGMMGAAITHVVASAGIPVVLLDVTAEAAERGKQYSRTILGKQISASRTTLARADAVLQLITPTDDPAAAAGCDLVVEAVFEDLAVKVGVFDRVAGHVAPDALLCTNTSTLPVSKIAAGIARESDVIGTHFFSPVDKMPLVEVVVGEKTTDVTLARAMDFVQAIRKTPIVVRDSHGFFTTRVIGRFMDEAISLVAEGVHPQTVERAAAGAGYPTGALALMDEISLTLSRHIRVGMAGATQRRGDLWTESKSYALVDSMIDDHDRPGRRAGRGFYDYDDTGARIGLWPGLVERWHRPEHGIPYEDMMDRMLVAQALDAIACLDAGIVRTAAEANVGSLMGIGYPAWTGGVVQFVDQFEGGLSGFVERADTLRERYGDRFIVPGSLRGRTRPHR
ncbi:3-hydroxyacyl-CoA dehydrogenase NAD-binding domain-containing protein (plasmid) [Rhodococcus sp. NBC_00297]